MDAEARPGSGPTTLQPAKHYVGIRTDEGCQVFTVEGPQGAEIEKPLFHVCWHSPDGFEWGYAGSGPADTALSILADALGESEAYVAAYRPLSKRDGSPVLPGLDENFPRSIRFHQRFKFEFIAPIQRDRNWSMDADQVVKWVRIQEEKAASDEPD